MSIGSWVAGRLGNGWARALRGSAVLLLAAAMGACGGSRSATGTDVQVTGSGPSASVVPGETVVFTMTVQNVGDNPALDIKLTDQLGGFMVLTGITCQASGGATCPGVPAQQMSIPSLPPGGTLEFQVSATVNAISSGTLSNAMSASTADDIGRLNNTATANASVVVAVNSLGVTQDGNTTASAGETASFKVVLANPTGGTATNNVVLNWAVTAPFALDGITYTCTAVGGAVCPADQTGAASMTFNVPTLALSHQLVFVFTVPIPSSGRGNIVSQASVTGVGDLDPSNNSSTYSTLASDSRNGAYQLFAADGHPYTLTIDFDAGNYTLDGNGASVTRSFTTDSDGKGGYTTSSGERLRTATDIVIGSHDFAAGVLPYVAARKFATSLNSLTGAFNLMVRNIGADGSGAVTHAATARVDGNVLYLCQDDFAAVQAASCTTTSLRSYLLSYANDIYTAVDSSDATKSFTFQYARSGGAGIILAVGATPDASSLQLVIGLSEAAALTPSAMYGPAWYPAIGADWADIRLTDPTTYVLTGSAVDGLASLFRTDNTSPNAMLQGAPNFTDGTDTPGSLPALDGAPIWIMQGYPLIVVFGATLSAPGQANASGLLQIGVP